MELTFDAIDERLAAWIARQRMFFVGSAPSGADGHVNVSPKGPIESLTSSSGKAAADLAPLSPWERGRG